MLMTSKLRAQIEHTIVLGEGPLPCPLMLIGERPGKQEAIHGRPFVGPAGKDFDVYLAVNGIERSDTYITNLVKTFADYDKPTQEEIDEWRPFVWEEINQCQPQVIGLLGTFAVEAMMGGWWASAVLNVRHGWPWRLPVSNVVVVPMYHPAGGLYDEMRKQDLFWDFQQLGKVIRGEVQAEYIDTLPSDDLAGITFRQYEDREAMTRVGRQHLGARRAAAKSTWGKKNKSDTFPEWEMEKRNESEAF